MSRPDCAGPSVYQLASISGSFVIPHRACNARSAKKTGECGEDFESNMVATIWSFKKPFAHCYLRIGVGSQSLNSSLVQKSRRRSGGALARGSLHFGWLPEEIGP